MLKYNLLQGKVNAEDFVWFNQTNGLPNSGNTCITEDFEGNIWFGSLAHGLVRYNGNRFVWFNKKEGLKGDVVRPVFQDSRKKYWFGTALSGVARYDGKNITTFLEKEGGHLRVIRDFKELPNQQMLVSSNKGIWLLKPDGTYKEVSEKYGVPKGSRVHTMLTYNDTLWLSVYGKGIAKYANNKTVWLNKQNGLPGNRIISMYKSPQNCLWLCADQGISMFNGKKFTHYTPRDGVPNHWIMQATSDRFGQLWFATYGGGLAKLDTHGNWKVFSKDEGISANNLYSILTDNEGNLWLGAQRGIDKVTLDKEGKIKQINFFGKKEGFFGLETNGQACLKDDQGQLWFGTINGVVKYNPKADLPNRKPPVTHITNVRLFFKEVNWRDKAYKKYYKKLTQWFNVPQSMVLPYDINHLSFDFSALSFRVPEKVRYQWKMEGADKNW